MKKKQNKAKAQIITNSFFESEYGKSNPQCLGCIRNFVSKQGVSFNQSKQMHATMNLKQFLQESEKKYLTRMICAFLNSGGGYIFALAGKFLRSQEIYYIEGISLIKKEYQDVLSSLRQKIKPAENHKPVEMEFLEVKSSQQILLSPEKQQARYVIRIKITPQEKVGYYYLENMQIGANRIPVRNKYYIKEEKRSGRIRVEDICVEYILIDIQDQTTIPGFKTPHADIKCYKPTKIMRDGDALKMDQAKFKEIKPKILN